MIYFSTTTTTIDNYIHNMITLAHPGTSIHSDHDRVLFSHDITSTALNIQVQHIGFSLR